MTGDLVERLREALDRAEEITRLAMEGSVWDGQHHRPVPTDGRWTANGCHIEGEHFEIYDEGGHNVEQAAFVAEHDPAHVLRAIQAHRAILGLHCRVDSRPDWIGDWEQPACYGCAATFDEEYAVPDVKDCPIVAALAGIYFPEGTE